MQSYFQDINGVSAEDIQIDYAVQMVLIATVKACLVPDASQRANFNVSIASVVDVDRRLTTLRGKNNVKVLPNTQVKLSVSFDVDKLQYLNSADGYSQMTTSFSSAASSGLFTSTLQTNAGGDSVLSTATGSTTVAAISLYVEHIIQLMYPSFAPTVSCRPTVTPTQLPTTRNPTRLPTTMAPTATPTTIAPTAMPTFKTSKFIDAFVLKYPYSVVHSESYSVDYSSGADSCRGFHDY
jgi:hypothetical protein